MTTIDVQVAASGDDGGRVGGSWSTSGTTVDIGSIGGLREAAYRFTGISGLSGVTIDVAYISLKPQSAGSGTLTKIYAEDAAAPTMPTSASNYDDTGAHPRTTAGVDWDGSLTAFAFNNSPSIVSVIQELADSYDSSVILIFHEDDGTSSDRWIILTFDNSSSDAPKLHIEYTPAAAGNPAIRRFGHTPQIGSLIQHKVKGIRYG